MKTWERAGYTVIEQEFDHDLHEFAVVVGGKTVATITPADVEDMQRIIDNLDAGADVDGWDDGIGGTISIPAAKEAQRAIEKIRAKVPKGTVTGTIIVDGEYTTLSEETLYGNYHIPFELSENNEIEFGSRITFHCEDGGFDVSETADELLNAGFNWWVEVN